MPSLNHTGPEGQGPKTCCGSGKCRKNSSEEEEQIRKNLGMPVNREVNKVKGND
jgi:hypothetical protein